MRRTSALILAALLPLAALAAEAPAGAAPGAASPKLCALTFDDGPDVLKTALVLDKLEKHGVVASFFVIGQKINDSTAPVMKRAVSMGCEIDNHSWGYNSLNFTAEDMVKQSIAKTTEAIRKYAGAEPAFFRPPNLAVSLKLYNAVDLPTVGGVVGNDWDQGTSAESRARTVLMGMRDGAIILLHDVQPDPHPTPEALDILIPELKAQGYEFVTLTELFKRKGADPKAKEMWTYVD
jgi:peptidoglycan/xylan/chitin deacetylase (PgdA/CDA1 family)